MWLFCKRYSKDYEISHSVSDFFEDVAFLVVFFVVVPLELVSEAFELLDDEPTRSIKFIELCT